MRKNKGFTLIELMIVIAIIAIIAAIAIPNLMESRIRANEATAVTAIKGYATAQVTFQVGRQGRDEDNTGTGYNGFADNYRNLYYGGTVVPDGATSANALELISKAHADAWATDDADDSSDTATRSDVVSGSPTSPAPYQGYLFMSPTLGMDGADIVTYFKTDFAQVAMPANSVTTGTNAYWVGQQGTVLMRGLPDGGGTGLEWADTGIRDVVGDPDTNPTGLAASALATNNWFGM